MSKKKKTKKQRGETRRQKLQAEILDKKNKRGKKSKYAQKWDKRKRLYGGLPLPVVLGV